MKNLSKILIACGVAAFAVSCEQAKESDEATSVESANADESVEESVEPMVEAVVDEAESRIATAGVTIGLKNAQPYFSASGYSYTVGKSNGSGIVLGSGDIDLSSLPAGDFKITIKFDDESWAAGWKFPSDPYQAIAIVVVSGGAPTTPQFGQAHWPGEFQAPTVSSDHRSITFVDSDNDPNPYEYSVAMNGPSGRVVLDPRIKNGGHNR